MAKSYTMGTTNPMAIIGNWGMISNYELDAMELRERLPDANILRYRVQEHPQEIRPYEYLYPRAVELPSQHGWCIEYATEMSTHWGSSHVGDMEYKGWQICPWDTNYYPTALAANQALYDMLKNVEVMTKL